MLGGGLNLEEILQTVFLLSKSLIRWMSCSAVNAVVKELRQRLISLGKTELQEILEEEGFAEVVCHFCNEAYRFQRR